MSRTGFPAESFEGQRERLQEQVRGLYLRGLVHAVRGMRRLGLSSKALVTSEEEER